ncbi:MAG: hypothetical protein HQL91_07335 [Magnetococcales bacterium]|nr:hypothetical protein [Magnetococcales bacterium]
MTHPISTTDHATVTIRHETVRTMLRLARALRRLALRLARPWPDTPETAEFDPGHEAVMMGYDFHLTPQGPRLIEVNTNAGGSLMAHCAQNPGFPVGPDFPPASFDPEESHQKRLLDTFWNEMALFTGDPLTRPRRMAILDDRPGEQFLYPEMVACATLLTQAGTPCVIVDPSELEMNESGVFHQGERVEMIYNRHCDFYLETPPLAGLKAAWLNRQICLTPNPRAYGLLADKRHLVTWSDPVALRNLGCPPDEADFIASLVPETRFLHQVDGETIWKERNRWVFKPCQGFGGRGVLIGDKISRSRFDSLDKSATLIQRHIPPAMIPMDDQGTTLKSDIRLFVYRDQLLGVAARGYRGQVTNFREPGNGFLPVRILYPKIPGLPDALK